MEVPSEPDLLQEPVQRQVPVRHDGELQAETRESLERRDDAGQQLEVHCSGIGRCKLARIEVCADGLEEHVRAVALQACEPLFVVAFPRVQRVVRHLGAKAGRDGATLADNSACGQRCRQFGHRIDEGDERPVRVDRDRVQLGRAQPTHCHNAHCTTATPSRSELHATRAVCARGRPVVIAASARNSGKITNPKRGSDRSGQRELG